MGFLRQSTSQVIRFGPFLDSTDGVTAETGLTIAQADMQLSKDGAAFAQKNAAGNATHDTDGWYSTTLNTTDTDTVGILMMQVNVSGSLPVWHEFYVVEEAVYDALYSASAAGPLQSTVSGRTLDVTATGAAGIDWGNVENPSTSVDLSATSINLCDTATTVTNQVTADVTAISGDTVAANNLESDYDGTGYNKSNSTIGTCTTNTDMRGTDSAALASTLGTPADFGSGTSTIAANLQDLADDGTAVYDRSTDSLQAIRDRGDAAWTTGGGGSITDILNVIPLLPNDIDLANTATYRLGLMLTNAVDDLPSAAEITPGTISIDRKAIGGTSWSAVVTDAACSELAGMVYYDEVFDSGTGYAEGDSIRVTFKSQKITVSANDYEISDSNGRIFYTNIRQTMRGTDSAALATALATAQADLDIITGADGVNLLSGTQASIDAIETDTNSLNDIKISNTLNTTASGNIGIDWANVENPNSIVDLSATDIQLCDTVTTNSDMRGTDNAALAANYTAARAGYLDNINGHTAQTGDSFARLGAPAGASVSADIAALNDISVADILTTQMTESYAANGVAPTLAQAVFAIHQNLMEFTIAGTSYTVKKLDSSTTAFVVTLDDATSPTGATR